MLELTQTNLDNQRGNCYATSLASIFELDLTLMPKVPDTDEEVLAWHMKECGQENCTYSVKDCITSYWRHMWGDWFRANNLKSIRLDIAKFSRYDRYMIEGVYHLINGNSPRDRDLKENVGRGRLHSVVGKSGVIYYDPHPSRQGLISIDEYELIVIADPSKPILEEYHQLALKVGHSDSTAVSPDGNYPGPVRVHS